MNITDILKRFSLRFQKCNPLLDEYVNLYECFKFVLQGINIDGSAPPSNAVQYWFEDYLNVLHNMQFGFVQRSSRSQPNLSGVASQDFQRQQGEAIRECHQEFLKSLVTQVDAYWWSHARWWEETKKIVPSAGHFLNRLGEKLGLKFDDPVRPAFGRCSVCAGYVKADSRLAQGPRTWTNHKNWTQNDGTQPCRTATLNGVSSMGKDFKKTCRYDLSVLAPLSFLPRDITPGSVSSVEEQLVIAKQKLLALNIPVTLESALKQILTVDEMRREIPVGMQHLLIVLACVPVSEAICETYGSMVEEYHTNRHSNTGPANEDFRLQQEIFVRVNGPPVHTSDDFVRKIVQKLITGQYRIRDSSGNMVVSNRKTRFCTDAYCLGGWKNNLTSETIKRLIRRKDGRKGCLENF